MNGLRTARLTLQGLTEADIAGIVAGCNDPAVLAYIPVIPSPYGEREALTWLATAPERWRTLRELDLAIRFTGDASFLGVITVRLRQGGDVGYWLLPQARGAGVMSEALTAVAEWAEREHGVAGLFLTVHPDNVASQRVAERAGLIRTGLVTHEPFRDGVTQAVRFQRPSYGN